MQFKTWETKQRKKQSKKNYGKEKNVQKKEKYVYFTHTVYYFNGSKS